MAEIYSNLRSVWVRFLKTFLPKTDTIGKGEGSLPPKQFCAAPWCTAVLFADGEVRPCSNSSFSLGNWHKNTLEDIWFGPKYKSFREKISSGVFPNNDCRVCFQGNSIYTQLHIYLHSPFNYYYRELKVLLGREIPELASLGVMMHGTNRFSFEYLNNFLSKICELKKTEFVDDDNKQIILTKLEKIATIVKAFLESSSYPPIVMPHRAVQIVTRCNAKCIHCLDVLANGPSGGKILDEKYLERAFENCEDMTSFFHHGSELLIFKRWEEILRILSDAGVKTYISTNGMLLTDDRMRKLIDSNCISAINISFDGATKETVEAIQLYVSFEKKVKNVTNLFKYVGSQKVQLTINLSFVLSKYNYKELPDFVRLIDKMRGDSTNIPCNLTIYSLLISNSSENYRKFLEKNHISLVPEEEIRNVFKATLQEAKRVGIKSDFNGSSLEEFVQHNGQIPQL